MSPESILIGRETQLEKFEDILERISQQRPISSNLLEYYGQFGMGKTTLLREMAQRARGGHVFVDFKELDTMGLMYDPSGLVKHLASHLGTNSANLEHLLSDFPKTKLPAIGFIQAYAQMDQETRLFHRPEWLSTFRNLDVELIKGVNNKKTASVLLFDNTDHAPTKLLDFVEEWVVNPLIQIKQVVAVWAGNRPWRWERPEIRRRLTSVELKSLDKVQVRELLISELGSGVTQAYIDQIYKITGGHPGAIQELIRS